jgi:autotransporter-associated beta strand protein
MGWRVTLGLFNQRLAPARRLRSILLASSALGLVVLPAAAQNSTWLLNPGSNDYNLAGNWSAGVPTGTATFGVTNAASVVISADTVFDGWIFSTGASAYTFSSDNLRILDFSGSGISVLGGSVNFLNGGMLNFSNASTAGGATFTNTGILLFNQTSTAGNANIVNTYILGFYNNSTAANATINNSNFLSFNGTTTAGNATIGNSGGLNFNNSSTAGGANITNTDSLYFNDSATAGDATIANSASIRFFATSSAGNASILSVGAMYFYNDATAGSAAITNGGLLSFENSSTGGTAAITNGATGVTDFSPHVGALGVGSIAGGGSFTLGANQLTVGGNDLSTNVTGIIADGGNSGGTGGSLVKIGTGTMTLSGANAYTGATTVNGGILSVNGSIASSSMITVNNGAILSGTGTLGNTTIASGGTLAPGNSIGTITVNGNLTFGAGSNYNVEVSPNSSDRTNVTGSATLNGGTVNASFAAGTYVAKQYTILNANGGLGGTTFNALVNSNLPSGFRTSLSYDVSNAYLDLALVFIAPPNTGLSGNQSGVGNVLVNYFNRNSGIPLVYGGLTATGLTQASGETATGSQQIAMGATTQFMGSMTDVFAAGRGGTAPGAMGFADEGNASADASTAKRRDAFAMFTKAPLAQGYDPRWSVWASGFGGSQTTDGNSAAGSNTSTSRIYGVAVGADYLISPATVAGFAMAGGGTNFSVIGGGSGRSDLFQIGGFVRHTIGSTYLSGALAYGWQDVTTNRSVMTDQLQARFSPNTFSGRFEVGNRTVTSWQGGLGLTPYAAVQFTAVVLPAYAETAVAGSNAFALSYTSKTVNDTRSELGLRTDKSYAVGDALLTLRGRAAWAHDFNTDRSVSATFMSLPGASFVVNGAAAAHDAALTTASAEMSFISGISLAATFEGEFSDVTRSYAGKGVVRYTW